MLSIAVDEETGEERKRVINKMRWKGYGPASIMFTDAQVSTSLTVMYPILLSIRFRKNRHRPCRMADTRSARVY